MTSHSGRVFLNSCVKVPIDPCNNCPAPIFNRPKMYLGRLTTTPMSSTIVTNTVKTTTATEITGTTDVTPPMWSCSGVRSLVKLYDSIPDYCDINHLPEDEFYSTLDTLRTTCRELRTKCINTPELECSSSTSLISSSQITCKHNGKKKKKKSNGNKRSATNKQNQENKATSSSIRGKSFVLPSYCKDSIEAGQLKGFKAELDHELKAFQQTLKEFEAEIGRPLSARSLSRPKSTNPIETKSTITVETKRIERETHASANNTKPVPTIPIRETFRKSYSLHDLSTLNDANDDVKKQSEKSQTLNRVATPAYKDRMRLSNYFKTPKKEHTSETNIPKIVVESPSSETSTFSQLSTASTQRSKSQRKKAKSKKSADLLKPPFTLFDVNDTKSMQSKLSTPSPVHPVARPNLAATLRVEVSKKKLKELQNNCTYHDATPQFDWEVRKTPAWKSLSLNETHKQILALRLATRKAEQDLQQREFALNMELMRQRVKSAPLLLEGTTYWGPQVGKLTHTCQLQEVNHACEINQRKQRRRSSRSRRKGSSVDCLHDESKMQTIQRIYATTTSNSRNSQRRRSAPKTHREHYKERKENDSGDDLCSVDRAYL